MVTSCKDLLPIYGAVHSYRSVFINSRAIAQLPVIVKPPGIELTTFVERQAVGTLRVTTPRGYFDPICGAICCGNANFYWAIFINIGAIAQLPVKVKPPGIEFTV